MKHAIQTFLALLLVGWVSSAKADHAVRAEVKLAGSHDDPKGSFTEVVKKQMTVVLSGSAKSDRERLVVKATFYADDLGSGQVVVQKEVQADAFLTGGRTELTLPEVTFTFTPEHGTKSGTGRRAKSVRVAATGRRYHGWVIKVLKGNDVACEESSHPALLTPNRK